MGAVIQDGFIFSDTIAQNIAIGDEEIDKVKLHYAVSENKAQNLWLQLFVRL